MQKLRDMQGTVMKLHLDEMDCGPTRFSRRLDELLHSAVRVRIGHRVPTLLLVGEQLTSVP